MAADLFDLLADNAWTLPTAHGSANLHVTELGSGLPIVTLHGGPGAHFAYLVDAVRRSLDRARFVLFDQRGSLLSPVPPAQVGSLDTAQLVADLETLRVALGQDRLRLFGHSWGSQLAQLYYQSHPSRVAGMILTGALWPFSPPATYATEKVQRQEELRNRPEVETAIRAAGLAGEVDELTPQQSSLRYRITGLAACSIYRIDNWRRSRSMHWNRDAAIAIDQTIPGDYDIRPALRTHPIPISVIQGDHDYLDPGAAQWDRLRHDHPSVDVTVIPRAGHNAWIDDPHAFDQALTVALAHQPNV
jgi:pimeloyl-ACP methyl ester carboxylesterase